MGLKKEGSIAAAPISKEAAAVIDETRKEATVSAPAAAPVEGGAAAAVARLNAAPKTETKAPASGGYKARDYDAEARGKTRCAAFGDAQKSPAIAGMKFKNMAEYLALCKEAADYQVAYTFDELPKK